MKLASLVLLALSLSVAFAALPVAAAAAKPLTRQQQKMTNCNAEAKARGLSGAAYTDFRNTCLKGGSATAKPMTQQEKMKVCNERATGKTGDERKTFMSNCLKGGSVVAAPATAMPPPVAASAPSKAMTQQEKMKACDADASSKKLSGDARKSYMSTCLQGSGASH